MAKRKKPVKQEAKKIGFNQMLRDVLIASMNKGQFPLAIIGLIVMFALYKMPAEDVSKLVFNYFQFFTANSMLGYGLFALTLAGWFFHAKWQRRKIAEEMERIGKEKSKWQKDKLKINLESSD